MVLTSAKPRLERVGVLHLSLYEGKKNGKEKKRNGKIGKQCHGIIIVFGANFFPWYCHTINYLT
jgi:hypothetical protein